MKNSSNQTDRTPAKQAGKTVPDKPRDCGPNVDTWPILDTGPDEASKTRAKEGSKQH
jgi:hypothetical protein